ncbi:MAG: sulfatase-like hydrolase/transferase [Streptosporangiaceae bacterium]
MPGAEAGGSGTRPNLLLITTDQQRHETVGPGSPSFLRTPHLDQLSREGVRFGRAYAQTPICVPSRVSLMTGQSPLRHGMTWNGPSTAVMGRADTLPSLLRARGYATAAIGKMHFSPQRARHGFDEMILPEDYYTWIRESGSPWQPMRHGLGQAELYPTTSTVPESLSLTSWTAERCVSYIRDRRDPTCPFFLWASFSKPHPPLDPPEPYASMYRDAPIPRPVIGAWSEADTCPEVFARHRQRDSYDLMPPEVVEAARAAYYGLVTHVDYVIGRILAALLDVGLFDETLILFTSDHGEFLGDHHAGGKVMFHEPSSRVPLILRPPKSWAGFPRGGESRELVTHSDVLPTLLAASGAAEMPADRDGMDLLDLSRGRQGRDRLTGVAMERMHSARVPTYLALVEQRWKYIWYPEGPTEQLFDLANDPDELVDLSAAGESQTHRARLYGQLLERVAKARPDWVADGRLVREPPRGDPESHRRISGWVSYHTERTDLDVRH